MKRITKLFAGIAVFAAAALGAAALAGCNTQSASSGNKFEAADTAEEAYGFSAATAGMIISGMSGESASKTTAASLTGGQVTDEQTIASLNEYMALVEGLLSEGNFEVVSVANDNAAYAQYEYKMTVYYYDLNGNRLQYETYYNQTLTGSHTDRDDFRDVEVTDIYSVEGVMIVDGADYPMEGRFVNETEGRESESTQQLRVELDAAANNYLVVTQESESEDDETETEYSYSLYNGGRLAERTTFEYESERGETEITMTISDRIAGTVSSFEFEKETEHGREVIKITVGGSGGRQSYIVRIEPDANGDMQYVYYSGGSAIWRGDR